MSEFRGKGSFLQRLVSSLCILLLTALGATAQQNVTIHPGDDVIAILQTVVDPGSAVTFDPGYYALTPKADGTGHPDLLSPPSGTTIRGAGSGFGPGATVLDCEYAFNSAIRIKQNFTGITVRDLTVINTLHDLIVIEGGTSGTTFSNVWALKSHDECVQNEGGDATFDFCVFGWCSDNVFLAKDQGPSLSVLTHCDLFLGYGDLVQSETGTEVVLRNSILYAGPGGNDIHVDGGYISVRASVGWDPVDEDPAGFVPGVRLGRLELNGFPDVDGTDLGQDPLYLKPPGLGYKTNTMDLHLKKSSPALTAGRENFDKNGNPTGGVTFAGSQGPAPADVKDWSVF